MGGPGGAMWMLGGIRLGAQVDSVNPVCREQPVHGRYVKSMTFEVLRFVFKIGSKGLAQDFGSSCCIVTAFDVRFGSRCWLAQESSRFCSSGSRFANKRHGRRRAARRAAVAQIGTRWEGVCPWFSALVAGHGRGAFGLHVVVGLVRIESARGRRLFLFCNELEHRKSIRRKPVGF